MNPEFNFFKTYMPDPRTADHYLGCLDGFVFLDFNVSNDGLIALIRISFDGYGCCNLGAQAVNLSAADSQEFLVEIEKEVLNQEALGRLVGELLKINSASIWEDALTEYGLIR